MATTIHALAYKVMMDTRNFEQGAVRTSKDLREGAKLTDKYKTSMQRAEEELKRLSQLQVRGAISTATYNKEVARIGREFDKTRHAASLMGKTMKTLTSMKFAIGSAIAFIGAGRIAHALKDDLEAMDKVIKLARRLNVEASDIVKIFHAASLSTSMSEEQVVKGLSEFQKRLGQAKTGASEINKTIMSLGLNPMQLSNQSLVKSLSQVADKYNSIEDSQKKAYAASVLFGKSGVEMVNLLNLGGEEITKLGDEMERLGMTWDDSKNKQIEDANDAVNRMGKAWHGMARTLSIEFAPTLEIVAFALTQMALRTKEIAYNFDRITQGPAWALGQASNVARKAAVGTAVALPQAASDFRGITLHAAAGTAGGMSFLAGGASPGAAILGVLKNIQANQETNNRAEMNQPKL